MASPAVKVSSAAGASPVSGWSEGSSPTMIRSGSACASLAVSGPPPSGGAASGAAASGAAAPPPPPSAQPTASRASPQPTAQARPRKPHDGASGEVMTCDEVENDFHLQISQEHQLCQAVAGPAATARG